MMASKDSTDKSATQLHQEHQEFGRAASYTVYGYAMRNGRRSSLTQEYLRTENPLMLDTFSQWLSYYTKLLLENDEVYIVLVRGVQIDRDAWAVASGLSDSRMVSPKYTHEIIRRSHPDAKSWKE
jgi:hypothetical protein